MCELTEVTILVTLFSLSLGACPPKVHMGTRILYATLKCMFSFIICTKGSTVPLGFSRQSPIRGKKERQNKETNVQRTKS